MIFPSDEQLALVSDGLERIDRLLSENEELKSLLEEADRRIVWESHGLGNDFSTRVDKALGF